MAALIDQIIRFTIEQTTGKNPALFRDAKPHYKITMPEIAAKDIARAGNVLTATVTAMDTAMANRTASRQLAATVLVAMLKHLGIDPPDVTEVLDQADQDAEEAAQRGDAMQAELASRNAPVPGGGNDDNGDPAKAGAAREAWDAPDRYTALVEAALAQGDRPVHVTVHTPDVTVPVTVQAGDTTVNLPGPGLTTKETTHVRNDAGLITKSHTVERPAAGQAGQTVKETVFERGEDGQLKKAVTRETHQPDAPAGG
jgi:hypothetical protein